MGKKRFNTDRILGISAMVISILTLAIFIYQTNIMRVQSKLSVKPRLAFATNSYNNDSIVRIDGVLYNKGLGPAIVDSIYIEYQNSRFEMDMDEFIKNKVLELEDYGELTRNSTLTKGSTFLAAEEVNIYTYECPAANIPQIFEYLGMSSIDDDLPFEFVVKYTSIYEDETWQTSSYGDEPLKVD